MFIYNNIQQYHFNKSSKIIEKAKDKEQNFLKPKVIKSSLPEFGGKDYVRKPILSDYDNKYDENSLKYYELFFNFTYADNLQSIQEYYSA